MSYSLGIDVGTTYTAAATIRDGTVEAFSLGTYQVAVPSAIFAVGDEMLFGTSALRRGAVYPDGLGREFKRRLGDQVPIMLSGSPYHADRLTALMTRWVVVSVTEQIGAKPDSVVITHPANWTPYQLGVLSNALQDVELGEAELLSEPAAAANDYSAAVGVEPGALVLVYDLGGGTFDVALLRREGDGFVHEIEPFGIERLGGIDFDEAVFHFALSTVPASSVQSARETTEGTAALINLRRASVEAKEALSSDVSADIPVLLPGLATSVRITRAEFEDMIRPMLQQTIEGVRATIAKARLTTDQLQHVLLVGGSSRIPLVSEMVSNQLDLPVRIDAHPKLVVAKGAARRAQTSAVRPPKRGARGRIPATEIEEPPSRRPLMIVAAVIVVLLGASGAWWYVAGRGDADAVLYAAGPAIETDPIAFDVEVVGSDLWVSSGTTGAIQRFDIESGALELVDRYDLGYEPSGGEFAGHKILPVDDVLYVTQQYGRSVARFDPASGDTERIDVEGLPLDAALLDGTVWVASHFYDDTESPGRLIPIEGSTVGRAVRLPGLPSMVKALDGELWVTLYDAEQVVRIDPASGELDLVFDVPGEPIDIELVDDEYWVTLRSANQVVVLSRSGEVLDRVDVPPRPHRIVQAFGSLWVSSMGTNDGPGAVSRLDPRSRQPVQPPIEVRSNPLEFAVGDDQLYVSSIDAEAAFEGQTSDVEPGVVTALEPPV